MKKQELIDRVNLALNKISDIHQTLTDALIELRTAEIHLEEIPDDVKEIEDDEDETKEED